MVDRKMTHKAKLSTFTTNGYDKGARQYKITLWYFVNALVVRAAWNPFMSIKIALLRLFGAKIGKGCVIKNEVRVKSPWYLTIGDHVWLGESCWIDNLDRVEIGNNVCISQGAMLQTGSHDYTKTDFRYRNSPVIIRDGAWIGARSVVCPGVTVEENAVLTAGSVATHDLAGDAIYQGNPAEKKRERIITEQ